MGGCVHKHLVGFILDYHFKKGNFQLEKDFSQQHKKLATIKVIWDYSSTRLEIMNFI